MDMREQCARQRDGDGSDGMDNAERTCTPPSAMRSFSFWWFIDYCERTVTPRWPGSCCMIVIALALLPEAACVETHEIRSLLRPRKYVRTLAGSWRAWITIDIHHPSSDSIPPILHRNSIATPQPGHGELTGLASCGDHSWRRTGRDGGADRTMT